MTLSLKEDRLYSVEEYLELEQVATEKHEWRDGRITPMHQIIAMAGGTHDHSLVIANVIGELRARLKGSPCRVYDSNLRVRDRRTTLYTYPDAMVICGPPQFDPKDRNRTTVLNPTLVVEVISPSSEADDRGDKFNRYRGNENLKEYVLVSQGTPRIETFLRGEGGSWRLDPTSGLASTAPLRSLGIELPLSEIYDGVTFPPEPVSQGGDDSDSAED